MALIQCKECSKEISSDVKKCPNCGYDRRNFFMRHKIMTFMGVGFFGFIFFIVVIVAAIGSGSNSSTTTKSEVVLNESGKEVPKAKDYELTNKLFKNKDFSIIIGEINPNYTSKYMSVDEGFRVVEIPITFENLSDSDLLTDSFSAKVDNKMVEPYYGGDKESLVLEKLLAGTSKKGGVYFEAPIESTELILVYDYGFWTDKKVEFTLDITFK